MGAKLYHQASAGETETKNFRENYMSDKIGGRSGSEGLGLTLVNLGAAWEGTRCHGRFLLTQQEENPTPGRPARPQGLS